MTQEQIYALKGDPDWAQMISTSLREGVGRFGWSYMKEGDQPLADANLRRLKSKIEESGFGSLTKDEGDRYVAFLLELKKGDWVIYINVPNWGRCTVARVTGAYYWGSPEDDDFNHRFPVDPASVCEFDRNSAMVHPALSARLKLQGRFWRVYAVEEFKALLSNLESEIAFPLRTPQTDADLLNREITPLLQEITNRIHRTHPNYALEGFLKLVFDRIPGVRNVIWQGGAGDHGADLIVEFEGGLPHPALQTQHTCVVQAKSYVGEHWDTRAVEDIGRAFIRYPAADMGLIVSTADSSTPALESAIEDLRNRTGKRIELLIGADVAKFVLRFASMDPP